MLDDDSVWWDIGITFVMPIDNGLRYGGGYFRPEGASRHPLPVDSKHPAWYTVACIQEFTKNTIPLAGEIIKWWNKSSPSTVYTEVTTDEGQLPNTFWKGGSVMVFNIRGVEFEVDTNVITWDRWYTPIKRSNGGAAIEDDWFSIKIPIKK